MAELVLAGGWGYNNLGDEAILAGYLEFLSERSGVCITSVDPDRTLRAQRSRASVVYREGKLPSEVRRSNRAILLAGGGYLNGRWQPEVSLKLRRLRRDRASSDLVAHSIEARELARFPTQALAQRFLSNARLSVRDQKSQQQLELLGFQSVVLPDAISLLAPSISSYLRSSTQFRGKILLNLLDISGRGDAEEAEIDVRKWRQFCCQLIRALGDRAVCMVVGGGDYRFVKTLGAVSVFEPRTVVELVSALGEADGLFTVRMHPGLLSSMLGKPTVSVPYCGKVRPTLTKLGVQDLILDRLDADHVVERLGAGQSFDMEWSKAYEVNSRWLEAKLGV